MPNHEEEEAQYLAILDELEATQGKISNYQGLLKELPEIFESKFNERLKAILDRNQQLLDEREQLLHQVQHSLPPVVEEGVNAPPLLPSDATPPTGPQVPPGEWGTRGWWLLALALLGGALGMQLGRQLLSAPSVSPQPPRAIPRVGAPSPAAHGLQKRAVAQALAEWQFFDMPTFENDVQEKKGRQAADPGRWERILAYWNEGVSEHSISRREDVIGNAHPWSAAFLSYVMKKAGAGNLFPYSSTHSVYISKAIADRKDRVKNAPLVAHRPSEYSPSPGDIICAIPDNQAGEVAFENVPALGYFPSRCDLVVSSSPTLIKAVGGDLSDAVGLRKLKAINGRLAPVEGQEWLVVIQPQMPASVP